MDCVGDAAETEDGAGFIVREGIRGGCGGAGAAAEVDEAFTERDYSEEPRRREGGDAAGGHGGGIDRGGATAVREGGAIASYPLRRRFWI